ncbi:MAG: c-type cytochrome [Cytophagaceae bacterium]|jgi:cytochrome c peroxidase|nr:c-type cytochrome [Cytophagaceae bacterium]
MKNSLKNIGLAALLLSAFLTLSWISAREKNKIKHLIQPAGWPAPVYDVEKNPITEEGFTLGRMLFYDPLLSADSTISCASCHLQQTNFTHVDHALSHGIDGKKGTRNSSVLVNLAWSKSFMWDGGINHIEVQPLAPIENPVEMNSRLSIVVAKLNASDRYRQKFRKAFGKKNTITGQQVLKALSAYLLSLQSFNAKYDRVMRSEPGYHFTPAEARGMDVFLKHCNACHTAPLFTNQGFENNGLAPDPYLNDGGRIKVTHQPSDSLLFKVPTLRNIEVSYPYMHDGRYKNLQMVLFHYSSNISNTLHLSPALQPAPDLTEGNKNDLLAFLKTLTDTSFLNQKEFGYPFEDFQ